MALNKRERRGEGRRGGGQQGERIGGKAGTTVYITYTQLLLIQYMSLNALYTNRELWQGSHDTSSDGCKQQ